MSLGNTLQDFTADNTKKTGLNGDVCDFSVDYDSTDMGDILNIHISLMKIYIYKCLELLGKCSLCCYVLEDHQLQNKYL